MASSSTHPDEVLSNLLSRAGMRAERRKGLAEFHRVCRIQSETTKDFSRAAISRLLAASGTAHERLLYSGKTGEYLELLAAWEDYAGAPKRQHAKNESPSWISELEDPVLRQLVLRLKSERDTARAELNLFKSATKISVHWMVSRPGDSNTSSGTTEARQLTLQPSEMEALETAVSPGLLEREGWSEGRLGEINTLRGREIYQPGYVRAIRKVVAFVRGVRTS